MSSVKVVLDTRSVHKDGTSPIKLRVSVSRKVSFYLNLDLNVLPECFDCSGGRNGQSWIINKRNANIIIGTALADVERELMNMTISGLIYGMSSKELKIELSKNCMHVFCKEYFVEEKDTTPKPVLLKDVFLAFCELKTGRTKEIYLATITKLKKVVSDYESLQLDDINKNWLNKLQNVLQDNNSINASAIHLRNIRAVWNYALDEELTTKYPFRKFKIQTEDTIKRSLTIDQLHDIINYPCEGTQAEYRDMFMLIFYLIGINITDLLNSKKTDVIDGRLSYHRAKTHKLYSIKIEPEALELINKYKGDKYLLCPLDRYKNLKQYNRRMNEGLQKIGSYTRKGLGGKKDITPIVPDITTYWARHTWATIAHKIGISKDVISMALGHSFGVRVTDTYIDYDAEKIDKANRMVIDYVTSYKKESPTT